MIMGNIQSLKKMCGSSFEHNPGTHVLKCSSNSSGGSLRLIHLVTQENVLSLLSLSICVSGGI